MAPGWYAAAILVLFTWLYTRCPIFSVTFYDSIWSLPVAVRLLYHGETNLDAYQRLLTVQQAHATDHVNGHYYNWYPVAVPVLASPVVWLVDQYSRLVHHASIEALCTQWVPFRAERLAASIVTALAAALLFLVGRRRLTLPKSLLWVALFAFGTSAWSIASRLLWQHTLSLPLIAAALYGYAKAERNPRWLYFTGLMSGLAWAARSTNLLTVLLFGVLIAWRYRGYLAGYAAVAIAAYAPLLLYNVSIYGHVLSPYMIWQRQAFQPFSGHATESMVGTLISPNRGFFVYMPVLVFCVVGLWDAWRRREQRLEAAGMALVVVGQWLGISLSYPWWGGYSYGPRLMTDTLPYCFMLLIPAVQRLRITGHAPAIAYTVLFSVLAAASVWIHYRGTNVYATFLWDGSPRSVDDYPGRIWSWQDMQILRGLNQPR